MDCPSSVLFVLLTACGIAANDAVCLHKGCHLSGGMYQKNVDAAIASLVRNQYEKDNLITVLQWNILYDKYDIGLDSWKYRKQDVCNLINKIKPTVIGLQEVMPNQLEDLKLCLHGYRATGCQRDNATRGLYNPVFWNSNDDRIILTDENTFWLSETPDKFGSMLPDSVEPRICTWTKLRYTGKSEDSANPENDQYIYLATTHLAYRSQEVATHQISIAVDYLKSVCSDDCSMFLTGDLNWESNSTIYDRVYSSRFQNSMVTSRSIHPELTALPPYPGLIDYVWHTDRFTGLLSATLMDTRPNGRELSDHRPVLAAFVVNKDHRKPP